MKKVKGNDKEMRSRGTDNISTQEKVLTWAMLLQLR